MTRNAERPSVAFAEASVPAGQEALTIRFTAGLMALPSADLRLFSTPLDLLHEGPLPREGATFRVAPGDYGVRLKARLGPAAKEVVTVPPETHVTVEVRLQEVWRLHHEESAGSFNRAFQTFEMEEWQQGWDGPPF